MDELKDGEVGYGTGRNGGCVLSLYSRPKRLRGEVVDAFVVDAFEYMCGLVLTHARQQSCLDGVVCVW